MKKKIICILILYTVLVSQATAELVKQRDVKPFVPMVMGMGGGYTAFSEGIYSLWYNPAGLSNNYIEYFAKNFGKEITAFAISTKVQPLPTELVTIYNGITQADDDVSSLNDTASILYNTGARATPSIYGGYIKHMYKNAYLGSFGFALTNTADVFMNSYGSVLSITMEIIEQSELMLGYAYNFNIGRELNIRAGAALRPFFRYYNRINYANILDAAILDGDVVESYKRSYSSQGIGIGADTGAQVEWYGLVAGVMVKDIFTPIFNYTTSGVDNSGATSSAFYYIPLSFNVGAGYNIEPNGRLGEVFNMLIYGELIDPFDNTNVEERRRDFITHVHFGTKVLILPPVFSVQAGFNQGYPTFGLGTYIKPVNIAFVVYTQEEGLKVKEKPSPGLGLEISIKW